MSMDNSTQNNCEDCSSAGEIMKTKDEKVEFSARLNLVLDYLGVAPKQKGRQQVVAKTFGVSQKGARKWLEGEAIPDTKRIPQFIDAYKAARITGEWLFHGNQLYTPDWIAGNGSITSNVKPGQDLKRTIPLLTWGDATHWLGAMSTLNNDTQWIQTTSDVGGNAFALIVQGNSMANPYGTPSIPEGYSVIVEPDKEPENNSIIVAQVDESGEAILRRLVIEGSKRFLTTLNPAYPVIEINHNCKIIGVVKKVFFDL